MSFAEVSNIPGIRIKIDTIIDNCFTVTYDTNVFKFLPCSDGLYYFDITSFENNSIFTNYSFLETVANNKAYFTRTEVKKAEDARALQRDIGWPSTAQFKYYISKQLINNSPITADDINRAEYIFGPAKPLLEGKKTRVSPQTCKIQRIPLRIKNKRISFESHAIVFIGSDNMIKRRSVPAVALNPSNDHGGHYFMNLYTGKKLHSYHWQELPIDDEIIDRVKELGMTEAQRRLTDNYPLFEWEPGMKIRDNEEI